MRVAVVTVSRSVHVRVYVEHLVAEGHDVTVFTNGRRYLDTDVPTVDLRPLGGRRFGLSRRFLDRLRARRLASKLATGRFDVVDCQMVMLDALTALETSPAPVILSFHGSDLYRREEMPADFASRLPGLLPRAAAIHPVSQHMAEELVALGAPADRIEVFQYGIDLSCFSAGDTGRNPHSIVSVRALKPLYRVNLLLEAMPEVVSRVPDARLAVYDHGPEERRLMALAEELGISHHVSFVGHRPHSKLAEDLARCAVWVSLAENDGTPLSLLEAMASGAVPVVADLPTLHEWIEPGCGVFVEPAPEAVAAGVLEGFRLAEEGTAAKANRAVVEARADRSANLKRYDDMLERAARAGASAAS